MESNFKRALTNLESDLNIKEGAFKEMSEQLRHLNENKARLLAELEAATTKEQSVSAKLAAKDEDFTRMGEALAKQAQEKAMLKMENMQMQGELQMAQQEIKALKSKR